MKNLCLCLDRDLPSKCKWLGPMYLGKNNIANRKLFSALLKKLFSAAFNIVFTILLFSFTRVSLCKWYFLQPYAACKSVGRLHNQLLWLKQVATVKNAFSVFGYTIPTCKSMYWNKLCSHITLALPNLGQCVTHHW